MFVVGFAKSLQNSSVAIELLGVKNMETKNPNTPPAREDAGSVAQEPAPEAKSGGSNIDMINMGGGQMSLPDDRSGGRDGYALPG